MLNVWRAWRRIGLSFTSLVVGACFLGTANATPSITLSRPSGPPTIKVQVSGTGFKAGVIVDLYFDKTYRDQCVTNSSGGFSNLVVRVPKEAHPGTHSVSAVEQPGGPTAKQPFLVQTNWRQFHFNADGRRVNPYENVLSPKTVGRLKLKWSYSLGEFEDSSPAVADGVVYIGGSSLYAVDATTGTLLWSFTLGDYVTTGPAVANGMVYFASFDRNVYALDARTGALRWSFGMPFDVFASPTVSNGAVYIGSDDGSVYALDSTTGTKIWSNFTGPYVRTPLIASGVAYFPEGGSGNYGSLYALDAGTGHYIWSFAAQGGVLSSPAVYGDVVYFGSNYYPGMVFAVKAGDGSQLWSFPADDHVTSSPAIENGVVYIGDENSNIYALNAATGVVVWSYQTGNQIWGSPAVANGVVYIGSADESLYALDAKSGSLLWSYATSGNIYFPSPAVANGMVYIASMDENYQGTLYAFGLPDVTHVKRIATPPKTPRQFAAGAPSPGGRSRTRPSELQRKM
jgi:outer membrane protein assembly factor BamB